MTKQQYVSFKDSYIYGYFSVEIYYVKILDRGKINKFVRFYTLLQDLTK
jgi:hypothetical protein